MKPRKKQQKKLDLQKRSIVSLTNNDFKNLIGGNAAIAVQRQPLTTSFVQCSGVTCCDPNSTVVDA